MQNDQAVSATVEVQQYADGDVLNPLTFKVTVNNRTQKACIVNKISIELQEPLASFWSEKDLVKIVNKGLEPNHVLVHPRSLPGLTATWTEYWSKVLGNPRLLTFWPGKYSGQVVVSGREGVSDGVYFDVSAPFTASFTAPLGAIMAGAVLGSILCIGFRFFWRRTRMSPAPRWGSEITQSIYLVGASAFTGIIVCLILYRTKGFELPFTVTVNDFFGGILVGFVAYKSMDVLYAKFVESEGESPEGNDKNGSGKRQTGQVTPTAAPSQGNQGVETAKRQNPSQQVTHAAVTE